MKKLKERFRGTHINIAIFIVGLLILLGGFIFEKYSIKIVGVAFLIVAFMVGDVLHDMNKEDLTKEETESDDEAEEESIDSDEAE